MDENTDTEFECSIFIRVSARNWQHAANQAQRVIDNNTDRWVFEITNLDSEDVRAGMRAEIEDVLENAEIA
jgi:hypothetical protein